MPEQGFQQLEDLRPAQRLQGYGRERQIPPQVGELGGQLRLGCQLFAAHGAKPQHRRAVPLPRARQVAQQVQGGLIRPVQVLHQQHQWPPLCQSLHQPGQRFKHMSLGDQPILDGGRQIGIAHAQLGQQPPQFGQPQVLQQILRRVFLLQPHPHRLDQRLIGQSSASLESLPAQHIGALGPHPAPKLVDQPRLADAGLAHHQHGLRPPLLGLLKAADQLADGGDSSDQRGDQFAWRLAGGRGVGRMGHRARCAARVARLGGTDVLGQRDGLRGGLDLQLLGQARATGGVDLQGGAGIALRQVQAHQAAIGLLLQGVQGQPAREDGAGLLVLEGGLVPAGEPIEEQVQAHLPLLLLQLHPLVKRSFLTQPEAVEEGAANEREGVLDVGDQRGAQLLGGQRGQPLDLAVGVLHHGEVQLEGGLQVQAEQFPLTAQVAVRGSRGVRIREQGAQQHESVAQGRASIVGLAVRPQESR
ncbi:MAG TPA: hypothetical protein VF026_12585 [Ktedonobacteraceae bacterium]